MRGFASLSTRGLCVMAFKILVADKLAAEGLEALKASGMSFDEKTGLSGDQLAAEVPNYDGMIVRSLQKKRAISKALQNPGKLKVIAGAGVGVDNIDLPAATAKGILVLNSAAASTLSTAEHALALMYALARKIPAADAHVRTGEWKRNKYQGTQLAGKTLGVVGLGRIGQTVATRALAMEMKVIGFDPYFSGQSALDGKVELFRDFDQFPPLCDVITFHVPGGEGTKPLITRDRLFGGKVKPNLLIVNDARGEVLDEYAVADALKEKKIAGAAIDVYAKEPPPKDHPLSAPANAAPTPHPAASTAPPPTPAHAHPHT